MSDRTAVFGMRQDVRTQALDQGTYTWFFAGQPVPQGLFQFVDGVAMRDVVEGELQGCVSPDLCNVVQNGILKQVVHHVVTEQGDDKALWRFEQ